jgi:hemoglobin/transferrin/lactoferrin receptor protein
MEFQYRWGLLFVSLVLAWPAAGQNIITDTLQLQEVVVSASKFRELKRRIPYQIEQIGASDIAFRNAQTSADVLVQSGQVFVQKSQAGGGSPVLRGFETNRILLVVDGVRMNNAIFRAGHLQNVLRVDQNMLEGVEVLYGPSSVVYGSDALGGVIHFKSKMPTLSSSTNTRFATSLMTRYASANNEFTNHIMVDIGKQKWGSLTSFTASDFGDVRQGAQRRDEYPDFGKRPDYVVRENGQDVIKVNPNPNVQKGTGYRQYDFLQKFQYKPSDRVQHVLNIQYSNSSDVPRYDRLTQVRNGKLRYGDWYYGPERRLLASYQLRILGTKLYDELVVTAAYQAIQESRNSRSLGSSSLKSQLEKVDVYSLNADAQKRLGTTHTLRYGLEYAHNDVVSRATFTNITNGSQTPADTRYPDGGNTMDWLAAYVTDQWNLTDAVIINAGARLNQVNLSSEFVSKEFFPFPFDKAEQASTALTGNLGLVWAPTWSSKFSVLGSTGFRAPNVDDIGKVFDSQPGLVVVPNPDLKPEYAYNLEFSVEQWVGKAVKVNGTAYRTLLRDAITLAPYNFNGQGTLVYEGQPSQVTANQNRQKAYVQGISLEANVYWSSQWRLQGTYTVTKGRVEEDNGDETPLDHIPPTYGKISLQWQRQKWQVEAFSLYNGWKRIEDYRLNAEDNEATATPEGTPAWYTLNVRTSYTITPYLRIQAAVENILDTNYRGFASGVSAPGRNFIIALRGQF